jgi:polysaccharide biosynthesis/export protein
MPALLLCLSLRVALAEEDDGGATLVDAAPEAAPALPTARMGYHLGPGDELNLQVYGEQRMSGVLPVQESGTINIPLAGRVAVGGLTVEQAVEAVTHHLASRYLVDPHVAISIQKYGSQPVQVLGAIRKPGTYYLTGNTNLMDILAQAGGVLADKTSQEIQIQRAQDRQPSVINLERLMSGGLGNVPLQAGDVVLVKEGEFVYVSGEVTKPGAVLWRDGVTVSQVVSAAGGPTRTANLKKVYILRGGQRVEVNIKKVMKGQEADVVMRPGDQIFVETSPY